MFSNGLAIDLGTANTVVFVKGKGIVLREPSVVAINKHTNEVQAVGKEAKEMLGRAPSGIEAIRPMKDGVIAHFDITEKMIRHFIHAVNNDRKPFFNPKVVIAIPSGVTEVEKRAVRDSAKAAGASEVFLIEEPMAAAIGVNLAIQDPSGSMIIDIGGGTTEVAIISLSGVVYSKSVRVAGDEMDEAIINYVKRKYNLLIGERMAEHIKINIGSAYPLEKKLSMEVKGRDLVAGIPKTLVMTDEEIREALAETFSTIVESVKIALERTPPELAADIVDKGVVVAGGGSMIKGLDILLREATGLPITLAEDPLSSVALGTGKVLGDPELLKKVMI
jgi:rod shape-determining protein MreB